MRLRASPALTLLAIALGCGSTAPRESQELRFAPQGSSENADDASRAPRRLRPVWTVRLAEGAHAGALSPDGSRVAICSQDNTTRVWEVASGTLLASRLDYPGFDSLRFRDDQSLVAGNPFGGLPLEVWRPPSDSTTELSVSLEGVDMDRCGGPRLNVYSAVRALSAFPCRTSHSAAPGQPNEQAGRVAIFSWRESTARTREIAVSDITAWPQPTAQRALTVQQAVVSRSGHVAVFVDLMNTFPRGGWLIVSQALVVLDPTLQITAANPLPFSTQAGSAAIAWTDDGSLMVMDTSMQHLPPGEWLAVRFATNGQIENMTPSPGYPPGVAQAYLAGSNRLLVFGGRVVHVLDAATGEILHQAERDREPAPPGLVVSADERYVLMVGYANMAIWELPP